MNLLVTVCPPQPKQKQVKPPPNTILCSHLKSIHSAPRERLIISFVTLIIIISLALIFGGKNHVPTEMLSYQLLAAGNNLSPVSLAYIGLHFGKLAG